MRRILMVLATMLVCAAPAAYAVDCDARISDGANLIKTGEVAAAASRLSDTGADVRVVTVSSLEGQGNLDNLFRAYLAQCRSWQGGGGVVKNNLVVFMVSVGERNSLGLFFNKTGPYAALNNAWLGIQADVKPTFKQRQFDSGIAASLDQIVRVTRQAAQLAPSVEAAPPVAQQAPVVVQTQPTDFSGLWVVLGWLAGGGFILFVAFSVVRMRSNARSREEKRRAEQLRGRNAKAACSSGITGFDAKLEEADAQLTLLQGQLLAEDIGDLPQQLEKARSLIRNATMEFGEADQGIYDPDRLNLSEDEYDRIADFFEGINGKVREALAAVDACLSAISKKRSLPTEAQTTAETARAACREAADAIAIAHNADYLTAAPEEKLSGAMTALVAAQKVRDSKQYSAAIAAAGKVTATANEAAAWCTGLPARIQAIASAIAAGAHHAAEVEEYIQDGKSTFDALAAEFNRSSYESIHGNGTEAIRELAAAKVSLDAATSASDMQKQMWTEAEGSLTEAEAATTRAEVLIAAIYNRKKHLERVRDEAKQEVEAAAADIESARRYIIDHGSDVAAGHSEAIENAADQLDEAREKLKAQWPDWPQIAKLAKAANEAADAVIKKARGEHEAAERKRQQAATNLREAKRAFAKAREYEKSHHSKVDDDVRRDLERLNRRLEEAERSSDLAFVIAVTSDISRDSEAAYSCAQHDVAAATPVYVPTPTYKSDDSVGGGSSSFDFSSSVSSISDSVGGGSTDF